MRPVTQQLLHLVSHIQPVSEVWSNWEGEFRLEILTLTREGMKLAHLHSKWNREPVTPPACQSSSSWPRLMQLCYRQFPYTP